MLDFDCPASYISPHNEMKRTSTSIAFTGVHMLSYISAIRALGDENRLRILMAVLRLLDVHVLRPHEPLCL